MVTFSSMSDTPAPGSHALAVQEAAQLTGWSARMLRYIDQAGLVCPERSPSGYRKYGPGELQRLRTLRELLDHHDLEISDVGFAQRIRSDQSLAGAVEDWLAAQPRRPAAVAAEDWLSWEQDKHQKLLSTST